VRAAFVVSVILGVLALTFGALLVFYWAAAFTGVLTRWLFGVAFVGVALANAVNLLLGLVMIIASMLTLAERKWSALMQDRIGPNRARFDIVPGLNKLALAGLPHFLADGIKMITKEDFVPPQASKLLYTLGPVLAFAPVFCLFAIVPVAPPVLAGAFPGIAWIAGQLGVLPDFMVTLQVAPNLDVGLLFVFALASLAVYGTSLAGWSSNNKLALLGGVRAAAQMIAYEVALGLSLVGCMMAFGTVRLESMTAAQQEGLFGGVLPAWGIFLQPIGFLLFFAAAFAETKRAPFDTPEGESEIIGYFIEYSGMRFGLFMISEFVEIVILSGIVAAVFLGGWHLPVPPSWGWEAAIIGWGAHGPMFYGLILGLVFMIKVAVLCWVQLLIRWTMPRFRYDQIQSLGWKILLPLALANVFVTGVLLLLDDGLELLATVGIIELALIGGLTALYPAARPASVRLRTPSAPASAAHGH
jgi:NADH-quinone oxidoreductase subunit H